MLQQETRDYSIFKVITSNREVDMKHVYKLTASIQKKNLLHLNPINVNSKMEVIDGQHRLEAAKILKLPIHYVVDAGITNEDISLLNTNKKLWDLKDYLNFWAIEGKPQYKVVANFINHFSAIPLTSVLQILNGLQAQNGLIKEFKEGRYEVEDIEQAMSFATCLKALDAYCKFNYNSTFIRSFIRIYINELFVFEVLIQQIEKQPRSFVKCVSEKQYLEMFEEIYNYRRHASNCINLKK